MTESIIGHRTTRIDGELKLTGKADYAADHNLPGQVYGYPVPSTIARGRLVGLDLDAARQALDTLVGLGGRVRGPTEGLRGG